MTSENINLAADFECYNAYEDLHEALTAAPVQLGGRRKGMIAAVSVCISLLVALCFWLTSDGSTVLIAEPSIAMDITPPVVPNTSHGVHVIDPGLDARGMPILSDVRPADVALRACWGIVGPGRIAHDFAAAAYGLGARLCGVAAGSLPNASARSHAFARLYNVPLAHAYGHYKELAADESVTMVYIATTNQKHYELAKLFLNHGKHVLLEKPATIGVAEFEELAALSRSRRLLLVTNFWTRFFPAVKWARQVVRSGVLGPVMHVAGDLAFQAVRTRLARDFERDRFFNQKLGGGAMLDMGCYLVMVATTFLASSEGVVDYNIGNWSVLATGASEHRLTELSDFSRFADRTSSRLLYGANHVCCFRLTGASERGVDTDAALLISRPSGTSGLFGTSLKRSSDFDVQIDCAHGVIHINTPANCPTSASYVAYADASTQTVAPTPCCAMAESASQTFSVALPQISPAFEPTRYPNAMGFVYVAAAFERCMYNESCFELQELPLDEQVLIVKMTGKALAAIGVYAGVKGM